MQENDGHEEVEESLDLPEEPAEGEEDTTDWKAEATKLREKAIAQRERTKSLKDQLKEAKTKLDTVAPPKTTQNASKADGLDETALDYLDVKGVTEREDIKVIENIVKKTGMTVREALKDEYVKAKLETNKATRDVKDATPSSTKRAGGNQGNELSTAIARYESSGFNPDNLPEDYKLRTAVVNAIVAKQSTNKPSWQK